MVRRLLSRRPPRRAVDAGIAGVLLTVGEVQVWAGWNVGGVGAVPTGQLPVQAVFVVAMVTPLAWRRARPLAVVVAICAAIGLHLLVVAPYVPFVAGLLPMAIANYTAAAYAPRWRPVSLVAVLAAEALIYARIPEERTGGEVLFAVFVAVGTWVVGDVVRTRLGRADRAVGEARSLLAEREAAAAAALAGERTRIARELHDVIAHSVSVMGVQAGAARTLLDSDPDAARAALLHVEATARDAVAELQRLLAVLRERDGPAGELTPQPGLAALPRLADQLRAAGLPVRLSVSGAGPLTPGVDLAAYRIVQEALTNALRHAAAPTTVTVRRADGRVEIEVRDCGPGAAAGGNTAGHGLVGMRERAQLYGGTLEAGPHPDGGFVVRACLPVTGEAVVQEPA